MKKMLIIVIALSTLTTSAFANSYCFDQAVFAVERAQNAAADCKTDLPLGKYDKVINALMSKNPVGYSSRVIKAMKKLNKLMYNDVYSYDLQDNNCLRKVFNNTTEMNSEVMDALIQC